jgi:hypothetical protein
MLLFATAAAAMAADSGYPKKAPKAGDVAYGKAVLVDDGKCPDGQIKEIVGGSREKSIPRQVRCVERPRPSQ